MKQNTIKLEGNGNIVIQDINGGNITINQNDKELLSKLEKLRKEDIAVLQQMINEQTDKFSDMFKTLVSEIVQQKNIVQNSTIKAKSVKIGDEYHTHYEAPRTKKHIGNTPPKPTVFLGRENSTEEIHEQVCQNKGLLLLVNGEGGIGKTTLASMYYHKYEHFYKHLIWLVADIGIDNALRTLAVYLDLQFNAQSTAEQQMQLIIAELKSLDKPVLLILDNANKLDDLKNNYAILRELPNVHILLTSRIEHYDEIKNYKVNTLSEKHAIQLFKQYFKAFKDEETPLLKKLLPAIGYNTLVVELLAKNLNEFNDDCEVEYTLQKLLEDIQHKGLLKLSKSDTIKVDWKFTEAKPQEIVDAMYDISYLDDSPKQILSVFAILPPVSIPYKHLKQFLPNIERPNKVLQKLAQEGWCTYNEQTISFKTNPVIAEVTRQKNKDRIKQDISPMTESLINSLDYETGTGHIEGDFEEIKQYVAYAENIARYPGFINTDYLFIYERIGNFYKTYGNLDKALKYFEDETVLFEELYKNYPNNEGFVYGLTISYLKLGNTHSSLGNLDKALKYFKDYTQLTKELCKSYPDNVYFKNNLAISYEKLGTTHSSLGNLDKALKYFEDETVLFEELDKSYPYNLGFKKGLAISYSKLGNTYSSYGNLDKALKYFENFAQLTKELHESYPNNVDFKNDLAISYEKLGSTHSSLGNLDKALKYFEERFRLGRKLHESYPDNLGLKNNLAISYEKLGETHSSLGNLDEALKYFEERFRLGKELHESYLNNVDFKKNLAISYDKLGETHLSLGNLNKALKCFEESLRLTKELYKSYPDNVNFKNNLAISYAKLGETHLYMGNLDKALKYFKEYTKLMEELYKSYPNNVDFKNGLAISYAKLGVSHQEINKEKAKEYFQMAEVHFKELAEQFPIYPEFIQRYEGIKDIIAKL